MLLSFGSRMSLLNLAEFHFLSLLSEVFEWCIEFLIDFLLVPHTCLGVRFFHRGLVDIRFCS